MDPNGSKAIGGQATELRSLHAAGTASCIGKQEVVQAPARSMPLEFTRYTDILGPIHLKSLNNADTRSPEHAELLARIDAVSASAP